MRTPHRNKQSILPLHTTAFNRHNKGQEKLDTEIYILCDYIYMKLQNRGIHTVTELR